MESTTKTIRIFVCDDHEIFAQALAFALSAEDDLEICSTATSIAQAKANFDSGPDVAIVDVRLNEEDGIDLVSWISQDHPDCRTIVLTAFDSDESLIRAHDAGASAFVVKSTSCDYLVSVIRDLIAGYHLLTPEYIAEARSRIAHQQSRHFASLSPSDQHLVALIARGLPDRQIAVEMCLSLQTIRNRVSRLLHVFQLDNRTQLAVLASQNRT